MTHIEALKLARKVLTMLSSRQIATWYSPDPLNYPLGQTPKGYYAGWDDAEYEVKQALTAIDTALKSGEHPTSEPVRVEEPNNLFKRLMKLGTPINTLIGAARSADGLKYHDVPQAWIDGMLAHAEEAKEAWDGIIVALVETATPNQVPYERRTENSTGARPNQVKVSLPNRERLEAALTDVAGQYSPHTSDYLIQRFVDRIIHECSKDSL